MNTLDRQLSLHINDFARSTGWLQPVVSAWATYGIAVFAVLMLLGWWRAHRRNGPAVIAAALWAPVATVLAVTINQPIAAVLMAFARVYIAAHYPVDMLAGLGLGIAVALVGWLVVRRPLTTAVERVGNSRLHTLTAARTGVVAKRHDRD
ncbi:phosphatase PAP2 family protein [Mycolicibacterium obuense]|uniref:Phosphatase PAP2 family protein n=1 Tax=Mycolicibacterium obuense TaxID=1807 RepID=A0A4V3AYS5_9MYCO|nr:phosphatase PAP2 family protein [Mycolicibacterium obuense]TDL08479.1 phosphatase PAP2 family protein [Mycolicibacterium obuense]